MPKKNRNRYIVTPYLEKDILDIYAIRDIGKGEFYEEDDRMLIFTSYQAAYMKIRELNGTVTDNEK